MMNRRIRSMIDEIFSEMKMTAENLALRDELMANAQARYEDVLAQGKGEEEAFCEVAASLEDVYDLLEQINGVKPEAAQQAAGENAEPQKQPEAAPEAQADAQGEPDSQTGTQTDLGDALNKAFSALGDFSQAIMPEAKKLYGQMDDATGGVLGKLGRAARKGMRDAQKAAGEAIDRLSKENGELVFDFGANKEAKPQETFESDFGTVTQEQTPEELKAQEELVFDMDALQGEPADTRAQEIAHLRAEAEDLRGQALIKDVTGDADGAAALRNQAQELDMKADVLEQAQAMKAAQRQAQEAVYTDSEPESAAQDADESAPAASAVQDAVGADGEINEDAFARAVDDLARDAEEVIRQAAKKAQDAVKEAEYVVCGADESVSGRQLFPAAGLRRIDIQLDADDVEIIRADGTDVETLWEARNVDGEPVIDYANHTLTIRRKNPDVFKTFFSVFKKEGGRITVCVPRGYAPDVKISTTSGDVHIRGVDVDNVKVSSTSGSVRVEPDALCRAQDIAVTTVSGHAAVSAYADTIGVTTVSGGQFVSCDAHKVDVSVVSGKVHVEGACDEWEVSAVSGDVELLCSVAPTKKVQISSVHGDVHLALPGDIRGFVAEATGALGCEIINEFGPNRYGTCALPIRMETMHGKLLITRL